MISTQDGLTRYTAIVVSGLPPACMNLATVLTGQFDQGNPVPLSNNAIRFSNLSDDDLNEIQKNLDAA